jgi:hypothetical protein
MLAGKGSSSPYALVVTCEFLVWLLGHGVKVKAICIVHLQGVGVARCAVKLHSDSVFRLFHASLPDVNKPQNKSYSPIIVNLLL